MTTLEELTLIAAPIDRCFDLALSVEVHLTGQRKSGETAIALEGVTTGLLALGDEVTWRARHFGIHQRLTTKITRYDRPHFFQDTMTRGIFRSMQHDHHFRILPSGLTEMIDLFRFAAPLPLLGLLAERLVLRRYMTALLRERNQVLKEIAESPTEVWRQYLRPQS